jgi:hypothetical protein
MRTDQCESDCEQTIDFKDKVAESCYARVKSDQTSELHPFLPQLTIDRESIREIFRLTVQGHSRDPLVLIWVDKVTIGAGVLEKAASSLWSS